LFGEADFAEGGGASWLIGVHVGDGTVQGLDLERDGSPLFVMNSDVDSFARTFLTFDDPIRLGRIPLASLQSTLKSLDEPSFEQSQWRLLADFLAQE